MNPTRYYSWKSNDLAKGCKQCVLGRKLVVFVTGICPKDCFYCPLSEQKKNKDVIFANERPLHDENDTKSLIDEAVISGSYGAGFTGGDPLSKIDRTARYISILKKRFGKKFHIHLYTILESLTVERLKILDKVGLDELRLHPDIVDDKKLNKIGLLINGKGKRRYKFDIGVEIPSIPGYEKQTLKLVDYFMPQIDFLNLNELEISDTNSCELVDRKFHTKDKQSYAVKGSQELAFNLMRYIAKKYPKANVHFCTCKLKDGVQLKERLRLRAQKSHKRFDIVTDDGTLLRGVIYDKRLFPSYSYKNKLAEIDLKIKSQIISNLEKLMDNLIKIHKIPKDMILIDESKLRIITNVGIVQNLAKVLKPGFVPAIVEQYPTYDQMEVDVEFL